MELTATTHVRRPRFEVFSFLTEHANHTKFVKENISCEQVTPGPMRVGVRLKNRARAFGRDLTEHFEVVELEAPRLIAKASRDGSTIATADRFVLESADDGTQVTLTVTVTPKSWSQRLLVAVLKPLLRRSFVSALAHLKTVLEHDARPAVAPADHSHGVVQPT